MGKQKMGYCVWGYRYAPESFHVSKGLPGQIKQKVPLSDAQRQEVGYLYVTQGMKTAVDYVKQIEREQERKSQIFMTYGFLTKEDPMRYVFCHQLRFTADDTLQERLMVFQQVRAELEKTKGKVEQFTQCELDGNYRPVKVKKNYITADFSRPVIIRLRTARQKKRFWNETAW